MRAWLDEGRLWSELLQRNETLIDAFIGQELEALIAANRVQRQLFVNAPFYPTSLYKSLASLRGFDRSWTFKTTGAGGEDAILVLGHRSHLTEVEAELKRLGWTGLKSPWSMKSSQVNWKERSHDKD